MTDSSERAADRRGDGSQVRVPFSRRVPAPKELEYLQAALEGPSLAGDGPASREASGLLGEMLGGAPVLLTPSCTHALELAALTLDLGPGDEAVLPSFTFSSTANALALRGVRLRFADIDDQTLSMELPQLQAALTPSTTVVMGVPYGGIWRDALEIEALCGSHGIRLLVDAAHALFASTSGRPLARVGALAALSFHDTKNIGCGEGGALVINDGSYFDRACILREKGTDRTAFLEGRVDKYTWRAVGSSYLLSDALAAILRAQLEASAQTQQARQRAHRIYRQLLEPRAADLGLRLQQIPASCESPAHVFAVVLPPGIDRSEVVRSLAAQGVTATSHYEPLHCAPNCKQHFDLPATTDIARRLLRLPLYAGMSARDAEHCAHSLLQTIERLGSRT